MDHVPLPSRDFWPEDMLQNEDQRLAPVLCVCWDGPIAGRLYDGGDFCTFPTRVGMQWSHLITTTPDEYARALMLEMPRSERRIQLAQVLQSWLFFGLLHAFLAPLHLYEEGDLHEVVNKEIGPVLVHTRKLHATLLEWKRRVSRISVESRESLKHSLHACFSTTIFVHQFVAQACRFPSQEIETILFKQIHWSFLCVSESLYMVAEDALASVVPHLTLHFATTAKNIDEADLERLRKLGWCPRLIAQERAAPRPAQLWWYYLHLALPSAGFDHSKCTDRECRFGQIDPTTYQLPHVDDGCTCEPLGPDIASVAACLDADTFPILKIHGDSVETVDLEIVPRKDTTPYVALSHIWADGLGNPGAMALRRCQLLHIRHLVEDVRPGKDRPADDGKLRKRVDGFLGLLRHPVRKAISSRKNDRIASEHRKSVFIWCDTLLVPVIPSPPAGLTREANDRFISQPSVVEAKRLKRLALAGMRGVYTDASHVLIVDRMMYACPRSAMDDLEVSVRLLLSRWNSRVWTLQEGALPRFLAVRFADQAIDVAALLISVILTDTRRSSDRSFSMPIYLDISRQLLQIRGWESRGRAYWNLPPGELVRTIEHRGLQYAEDEPLVLGALLGVDAARLVEKDTLTERMVVLWQDLAQQNGGFFPVDIIFNTARRVNLPGFRWAPISFRRPSTDPQSCRPITLPDEGGRAKLTPHGIRCTLPGWRVNIAAALPPFSTWPQKSLTPVLFRERWSIPNYIQMSDGSWHSIVVFGPPGLHADDMLWKDPSSKDYCIIHSGSVLVTGLQEGLFGRMIENADGEKVFHTSAVIGLQSSTPSTQAMLDTARQQVVEAKSLPFYRTLQKVADLQNLYRLMLSRQSELRKVAPLSQLVVNVMFMLYHYWFVRKSFPGHDWARGPMPREMSGLVAYFWTSPYLAVVDDLSEDHEWIVD